MKIVVHDSRVRLFLEKSFSQPPITRTSFRSIKIKIGIKIDGRKKKKVADARSKVLFSTIKLIIV